MLLLLLLAAAGPCAAAELRSGAEERACFARVADETDRAMAAQWSRTLATLRRDDAENRREHANKPEMAVNLLASQRAWLHYRDAQCGMVSDQWAGASGNGELDSRCRVQLNRQRTEDLRRRAEHGQVPPIP